MIAGEVFFGKSTLGAHPRVVATLFMCTYEIHTHNLLSCLCEFLATF